MFGLSHQATAQHNPNSQPSTSGYAVSGSGESIHTSATRKPVLWAVVRRNGTLARGKGALDANLVEPPGGYEVLFDQNVRKCVYTATIGLSGFESVEDPGEITVVGRSDATNGVFVLTTDSAGSPAARGFHLAVNCPT